jgi:hypothetical protein
MAHVFLPLVNDRVAIVDEGEHSCVPRQLSISIMPPPVCASSTYSKVIRHASKARHVMVTSHQ